MISDINKMTRYHPRHLFDGFEKEKKRKIIRNKSKFLEANVIQ